MNTFEFLSELLELNIPFHLNLGWEIWSVRNHSCSDQRRKCQDQITREYSNPSKDGQIKNNEEKEVKCMEQHI